uniref:RNA-dependent RNA polymerase n=1 Tax=Setaria viridis TaxID=4556 RepID=A0A4U6UFC6_SETVI|nr:probable RNA-dependent RNA polymerase 3 [Setaria viridis]TKW14002.1 hypothetical protein SEVIR_5G138400v2 [Setaria viridis]
MAAHDGEDAGTGSMDMHVRLSFKSGDNRQVSGKVLVYKHPGLHFGDIHKLTATHIDGLEEIVGDSKYDIFFQPLDHGLWLMKWPIAILMETCIGSHGTHSYVLGTSANCWLTLMDRLLTPGVSQSEKDLIKINMLELVDIYYWALNAPKNGNKG